MNRYFASSENDGVLEVYIFGDIVSYPRSETDVSVYSLVKILKESDAKKVIVKINSYGGEVAEALAIYNELKDKQRNGAEITTMNMGFACSAASVIFCAGQNRLMAKNSLLMIHNPWICAAGNANDLRKEAETLDKITQSIKSVYLNSSSLTDEELTLLLDDESWIDSQDAVANGLATAEIQESDEQNKAAARVRHSVFDIIAKNIQSESTPVVPEQRDRTKVNFAPETMQVPALSNFEKMFNKFKGE